MCYLRERCHILTRVVAEIESTGMEDLRAIKLHWAFFPTMKLNSVAVGATEPERLRFHVLARDAASAIVVIRV